MKLPAEKCETAFAASAQNYDTISRPDSTPESDTILSRSAMQENF
jgi:hypothetical protein